jgi:hypothetical protein
MEYLRVTTCLGKDCACGGNGILDGGLLASVPICAKSVGSERSADRFLRLRKHVELGKPWVPRGFSRRICGTQQARGEFVLAACRFDRSGSQDGIGDIPAALDLVGNTAHHQMPLVRG